MPVLEIGDCASIDVYQSHTTCFHLIIIVSQLSNRQLNIVLRLATIVFTHITSLISRIAATTFMWNKIAIEADNYSVCENLRRMQECAIKQIEISFVRLSKMNIVFIL